MSPRRVLLAAIVVAAIGLVWWASGLGRTEADPADFFTREQIDRANEYRGPRYWGVLAGTVLNLGVLSALAFTPAGDALLRPLRGWPWALGTAAAAALVVVASALARLPLSYWLGHAHERAWGFSTQSAAGWFGDWARSLGVSVAIAALVYTLLLGVIRWLPRGWPAVAALGVAAFVVLASFVWPVVVEPIFNDFRPLDDRERAARLLALADRAGVPVEEVLVSDQSKRTTKENAYVSGFGETKRIVVYDTLLAQAPFDEVELVVAHELGHRREGHVEKGTAVAATAAAAGVVVMWLLLRSPRVLELARAESAGSLRVVPFLLLVAAALTLVTAPPGNWLSRRFEEGADRFALELTGDEATYMRTQRGLSLRNLGDLDPGPVVYRFLYTHPAPAERLGYARRG